MSDDPSILRNFNQVFAAQEDGRFNRDISDAFRQLLQDMEEAPGAKAKGSLTIKLNVKLDDGIVEIDGDFRVTAPKRPRGRSVHWKTPEGNLSRRNPNQHELPLRDVKVPSAIGLA